MEQVSRCARRAPINGSSHAPAQQRAVAPQTPELLDPSPTSLAAPAAAQPVLAAPRSEGVPVRGRTGALFPRLGDRTSTASAQPAGPAVTVDGITADDPVQAG